jgi:hypothetical protein
VFDVLPRLWPWVRNDVDEIWRRNFPRNYIHSESGAVGALSGGSLVPACGLSREVGVAYRPRFTSSRVQVGLGAVFAARAALLQVSDASRPARPSVRASCTQRATVSWRA